MAWITEKTANHQDASLDDKKVKEILTGKSYVKNGQPGNESFFTAKGEYEIPYSELYTLINNNVDTVDATKVAEINSKIGTVVNGYNAQSLEWQIFYADQSETFLISKTYATSSIFPIPLKGVDKQQEYEGSKDVTASSYGLKWNSKWLAKCTTESESSKAKATAYLCDSNNWKSYVQSPATYAAGGPTLELFIASWNKSQNTNLSLVDDEIDKDGYVEDKPEELYTSWPINSNIKNGVYYEASSTSHYDYWLASPCRLNSTGNVFCIQERYDGTGRIYATSYADFQGQNCNIRPIVSIPTSKINVSGDTVTVLP